MNSQCSKSNLIEAVLKGTHLSNQMIKEFLSSKIIMKEYSPSKIMKYFLDKIIMKDYSANKIIMKDCLYLIDLLLKTIIIIFSMITRNYNRKNHFLILIPVRIFSSKMN
jgi:hypothetical protein